MTMITPSYLGETIEYSSLHACRSTLEDPTYLLHEGATVFKEDDNWYLLVHTTCKHLQSDNRCGIYETRPLICRDYSTKDCEYEDDWLYDQYIETAEQAAEYAEALLGKPKGQSIRSPKPPLLPVISR